MSIAPCEYLVLTASPWVDLDSLGANSTPHQLPGFQSERTFRLEVGRDCGHVALKGVVMFLSQRTEDGTVVSRPGEGVVAHTRDFATRDKSSLFLSDLEGSTRGALTVASRSSCIPRQVGLIDFERADDPPEDMPACYHRGLELRVANPADRPNPHTVNTLTASKFVFRMVDKRSLTPFRVQKNAR